MVIDPVPERRISSRLLYSQQKKPFYGTSRKRTESEAGVVLSKKAKVKLSSPAKKTMKGGDGGCEVDVKERDMSVYASSKAKIDDEGKSYVAKLKETLRRFNLLTFTLFRNEWGMGNVATPNSDAISKSDPEYCHDAGSRGNVARYINHNCEPNLFVQCVLGEHHDVRLARIVSFAADNIPPLQELSYIRLWI